MLHMRSMNRFASGGIIYLLICSNGGRCPLVLEMVHLSLCTLGHLDRGPWDYLVFPLEKMADKALKT